MFVPFNDHAMEILSDLRPDDAAKPFLRNSHGEPWHPDTFRSAFVKERRRIGLSEEREFRELRTTAGTLVAESERPDLVSALLGHADQRTSRRYTKHAQQKAAAIEASRVIPSLRNGEK